MLVPLVRPLRRRAAALAVAAALVIAVLLAQTWRRCRAC